MSSKLFSSLLAGLPYKNVNFFIIFKVLLLAYLSFQTRTKQNKKPTSLFLAVLASWQKLRTVLEPPRVRAGNISVYNDIKKDK